MVVTVTGLDELIGKYKQFDRLVARYHSDAAVEAIKRLILPTEGVQKYPPATEANQPGRISIKTHKPMGYYQRGKGWWYPIKSKVAKGSGDRKGSAKFRKFTGVTGYRLRATSERYGTQYYVKRMPFGAAVGNRASYARYVGGITQSRKMAAIGWRKYGDVARELAPYITFVFQAWTDKLLEDVKLK